MSGSDVIKRANWLELFFDLVFVFAVAKATHVLVHTHDGHVSAGQYGTFMLIMVPLWWAWVGHTLFATRFDTEDTVQRLLTLTQMLAAVFLAAFVDPDFDSNYHGFLYSYLAIRFLVIVMYVRAAVLREDARPIAVRLGGGFAIGLSVIATSLLFEPPWRYVVVYAGIAIEVITPLFSRRVLKAFPVNAHHLPERVGLLTIILLGESVVALAAQLGDMSWTPLTVPAAVIGFVSVSASWWVYFDAHDRHFMGHDVGTGQRIIYGHLGIYASLSVISTVIRFGLGGDLTVFDHSVMAVIGLAGFIGSMVFLHGTALLQAWPCRIAYLVLIVSTLAMPIIR